VEHPVCDVCSRTLLKGEQVHEYVSSQGERFGVCVLCRSRAEASGWIPAEQYGTIAHEPPARARRGQALRKRLAGAASRARAGRRSTRGAAKREREPEPTPEPEQPGGPEAPAEPEADPPPELAPVAEEPPREMAPEDKAARAQRRQPERPKREPARETAPPQSPRPRRGPEAIMRRAVESFNSSEESRKVAGLIRPLGEPQAAVVPNPSRQLALVTVAWELSWYQWEVGADGNDEWVREVAKGDEVSELAEEARAWNAAVSEDGRLRLRAAGRRRQVVNVDGGARGNPGPAAIAAVLADPDGEVIEERSELIGPATNNVAEYRALLLGIERARALGAGEVELIGDSELVVRQVRGEYRVKDAALRELHGRVREALDEFDRWSIGHVRREANERADQLVNEALDATP
jgi:ribonuclease HI